MLMVVFRADGLGDTIGPVVVLLDILGVVVDEG